MNGVLFLAVVGVAMGSSQAGLGGDWNEVPTNDENIQEIADWAVAEMGPGYSLIKIQHAEQQVQFLYHKICLSIGIIFRGEDEFT